MMNFPAAQLPRHFDARKRWPLCSSIHDVPNQGGCGSCFAVAVAGVASDRSCIATNGSMQVKLSAEDIIGCCPACGDCYGGDPLKAFVYWVNEGLVTGQFLLLRRVKRNQNDCADSRDELKHIIDVY
ncbi:unnamed protein product [Gongylonema pulchrum]|uniref:Peptidase C1A papain C-terminal domain-containing protein n=1 Tax=Gongylonema pulchrum TaxID=637853 RepID=A0A3P7P929_9BILA|nr:unnamed protein product [Gongylonema pulchrum]